MDWQRLAALLSDALGLIGEVVSSMRDRRKLEGVHAAADALTVIGAIVESVRSSPATLDLEVAEGELARLRKALANNDEQATKALHEKFDT